MKDIVTAKHALGIRITRTKEEVTLNQEAYIEAILARFQMDKYNPVTSLMNVSEKLRKCVHRRLKWKTISRMSHTENLWAV